MPRRGHKCIYSLLPPALAFNFCRACISVGFVPTARRTVSNCIECCVRVLRSCAAFACCVRVLRPCVRRKSPATPPMNFLFVVAGACRACRITSSKVTESYRRLPKVTEGYRRLPKVAEGYRRLPKVTESYRRLPKVTESCRKLPKVTESYLKLPKGRS